MGEPEQLGAYRVLRQIGSGGMASIHEALDTQLGQRVAIKRLHPHIASRPGAAERFLREGRAAARIRHPHVVQMFALGGQDVGGPYLAMELLEGRDLGDLLSSQGRLGASETLGVMLPVIAGVAAAHDAGVVHRDLKPSNVFIASGPGGRAWPKVLDFGVSKVLEQDGGAPATATDGVIGTAAYMAPEQARAARNASFLSDQYSLGVMLYQCLTGELPFATAGVYDLLVAIMTAPLAAPGQRVPGIPAELDEIVLRAMDRDPARRFPSVHALGAALLPLASERDRLAWAAELSDRREGALRGTAAPATVHDRAADTPATMSPTARDTRTSSRWGTRTLRRALPAFALMALICAGAVVAAMGDRRPGAISPSTSGEPAPDPVSASAQTAATVEEPELPAPPSPVMFVAPGRPPVVPRPAATPDPRRTSPRTAASASTVPPSPAPSASATPAMGNNGAPILP